MGGDHPGQSVRVAGDGVVRSAGDLLDRAVKQLSHPSQLMEHFTGPRLWVAARGTQISTLLTELQQRIDRVMDCGGLPVACRHDRWLYRASATRRDAGSIPAPGARIVGPGSPGGVAERGPPPAVPTDVEGAGLLGGVGTGWATELKVFPAQPGPG